MKLQRRITVNWTLSRIIYDSTASGSRHIWIMNADGSDQRKLTNDPYDDGGGHVSPDGRYVVFISSRTGIFHIYRMDIDGNNRKQLTSATEGGAPFFSPDGRWVIYSANTGSGGGSSSNLSSWKVPADG